MAKYGRNCQKAHLKTKTFHLSLLSSLYDLPFASSSPYRLMFRNTDVLGSFYQFPVTECGRNFQKAHLHTKTFHLRPLPYLYDHPLQRNSLEKLMFRKTVFEHFGQIRPFPVVESGLNCQKAHPHFETFHLSPSVTKIKPGKESMTPPGPGLNYPSW